MKAVYAACISPLCSEEKRGETLVLTIPGTSTAGKQASTSRDPRDPLHTRHSCPPHLMTKKAGDIRVPYAGEGHGNPLQPARLESPVDRGAWSSAVREATKSWTRLND